MQYNLRKKNIVATKQGFTLIEALVAIFILTISVTGLLGVVSQSVFNANYAKNKVIATAFAQEGVELIRGVQDYSLLVSNEGDENITFANFLQNSGLSVCVPPVGGDGACYIEGLAADSVGITPCPMSGQEVECPKLEMLPNGIYDYVGQQTPSPFTRSIRIEETSPNSGVATVTVSWLQGSVEKNVTYKIDLFLWI